MFLQEGAGKASEEGTLKQGSEGQDDVGEVIPGEQHRETSCVGFGRDRRMVCEREGKGSKGRQGKAAGRPGGDGLASQERRCWSRCNGKALLVPGSDRFCF